MSDDDISLADAEVFFGPEDWEHIRQSVAAAPEFSPEQREKFRALFATVRIERQADTPAADAA
ncbi:hypothetical protein [Streptomyces sp. NPDC008240]|uniref:hypothetical protein n=1 Tax=Streptomyces sp. NPDC008240 TaxID=3364822 RepID=UPI0036EB4846